MSRIEHLVGQSTCWALVDLDGTVVQVSRLFCRKTGLEPDEAIGHSLGYALGRTSSQTEWFEIRNAVLTEGAWAEQEPCRANGDEIYRAVVNCLPLRGDGDAPEGIVVLLIPLPDRNATVPVGPNGDTMRSDAQVEAERSFVKKTFELADKTTMIGTDTEGIITLVGPSCEQMLGYRPEELVGHSVLEKIHDPAEIAARALERSS